MIELRGFLHKKAKQERKAKEPEKKIKKTWVVLRFVSVFICELEKEKIYISIAVLLSYGIG